MNTHPVAVGSSVSVATQSGAQQPAKYRISALFAGLRYMWRGWAVGVPVLVINSLLQVLLILPTQAEFSAATLLIAGIISVLVWLLGMSLLIAATWLSLGGSPQHAEASATTARSSTSVRLWPAVLEHLCGCGWQIAVSLVAALVIAMAGFAAWLWLGVVLATAAVVLPLASVAGVSPARCYLILLRYRAVRWLLTTVLISIMFAIAIVAAGVQWFFIPGIAGSIIGTLVWGFLAWWWITSVALIIRSALIAANRQ